MGNAICFLYEGFDCVVDLYVPIIDSMKCPILKLWGHLWTWYEKARMGHSCNHLGSAGPRSRSFWNQNAQTKTACRWGVLGKNFANDNILLELIAWPPHPMFIKLSRRSYLHVSSYLPHESVVNHDRPTSTNKLHVYVCVCVCMHACLWAFMGYVYSPHQIFFNLIIPIVAGKDHSPLLTF